MASESYKSAIHEVTDCCQSTPIMHSAGQANHEHNTKIVPEFTRNLLQVPNFTGTAHPQVQRKRSAVRKISAISTGQGEAFTGGSRRKFSLPMRKTSATFDMQQQRRRKHSMSRKVSREVMIPSSDVSNNCVLLSYKKSIPLESLDASPETYL